MCRHDQSLHYKNLKTKKKLRIHCVTMIDPATGWLEIVPVKVKDAATVANVVEMTWLNRYPWSQEIVFDRGT